VFLQVRGIQTSINYPTALPFLPAYGRFNHRPEQFPNAVKQQSKIISLPMFAGITASQQEDVIGAILEFCRTSRPSD
jgi:dTDP-4-amino-4,6-dideoxygalactose transaminase